MSVETADRSVSSDPEKYQLVGGWPGESVAFGCDFNRGRSVFARACFMRAFPEVTDVTSFAISPRYHEILLNNILDPHVFQILKQNEYSTDDQQTYLGNQKIDPKTDYIVLVDRFGREENREQRKLFNRLKANGRSVVCIPTIERTRLGDGDKLSLSMRPDLRKEAVSQTFKDIESLVFTQLRDIMLNVRCDKYKKYNGIVYPFGVPDYELTTFEYLRRNFGLTGDI